MGIDYGFRFSPREPDLDAVSDDEVRAAFEQSGGGAAFDDVKSHIRRSLGVARLQGLPDPLDQLHRHFVDQWGRNGWICCPAFDAALAARGLKPMAAFTAGETNLWHDARDALATALVMTELVDANDRFDDHDREAVRCLVAMLQRAAHEGRALQFLVMP